MASLNGQQIIDEFDKNTDEMSELSADQKLELADAKYRDVLNDRDWEFLRKAASVVVASGEIAVPADFRNFAENNDTSHRFGFWIGTSFYPVISLQDRRTHTALSYYDTANSKIVLADGLSLDGQTASFDYFYKPDALTVSTEPVFNGDYHKVISYKMSAEHYPIDQTEDSRNQNQTWEDKAEDVMEDMVWEDDQLKEDWSK